MRITPVGKERPKLTPGRMKTGEVNESEEGDYIRIGVNKYPMKYVKASFKSLDEAKEGIKGLGVVSKMFPGFQDGDEILFYDDLADLCGCRMLLHMREGQVVKDMIIAIG